MRTGYQIGIPPPHLWDLTFADLLACVDEYNKKQTDDANNSIAASWRTAGYAAMAINGKLRKLDNYLIRPEFHNETQLTREQVEEIDRKIERKKRQKAGD